MMKGGDRTFGQRTKGREHTAVETQRKAETEAAAARRLGFRV